MAEADSLEVLLNQATSPLNQDEDDYDAITRFCDQVNKDLDGAHEAVQLLVHKITSPQEKEALLGLTVLEVCVRNCGNAFHAEIGKFRFLNEMIKVISPKYFGNKRSDRVKTKCIELMYCWTKALAHEGKIVEAYQMLKKQQIVKDDPTYMDKACDLIPVPKPRPKKAVFEDEDKSKLLARLLKSKHPEDLQAANRLIKNMVKQDAEKNEKVSRRIRELDNVNNNLKLLVEMLDQYDAATSTASECDVMKELHDSLEKQRPTLFKLASDADDKDMSAMNEILEANDQVMKVVERYKSLFGIPDPSSDTTTKNATGADRQKNDVNSLLDLGFDAAPLSDQSQHSSADFVNSELANLGINEPSDFTGGTTNTNILSDFNDLFSTSQNTSSGFGSTAPLSSANHLSSQPHFTSAEAKGEDTNLLGGDNNLFTAAPLQATNGQVINHSASSLQVQAASKPSGALADLDFLGQSLIQKSLPPDKPALPFIPSSELNQKPSLNQIKQSQGSTAAPQPPAALVPPSQNQGLLMAANVEDTSPPSSANNNKVNPPIVRLNPSIPGPLTKEMLSLTDLFVPVETIKPASVPSVTIYDKNGIKIVIHFGREGPKPHILVMVVSTMSTNQCQVKDFIFQAAVPKAMRVKLQPPSATELPPFNPILPPTAITQVMLLANPQKEQIRLKYKITYSVNEQPFTDVGDYDEFPVQ